MRFKLGNIECGVRPLTPTLSHRERELSGALDWLVLLRNVTIKKKGEVLRRRTSELDRSLHRERELSGALD